MTQTKPEAAVERILVATDFSTTAEIALHHAVEIAKRHGATIELIHVIAWLESWLSPLKAAEDFTDRVKDLATERLTKLADSLAGRGVEIATRVGLGQPSQAILKALEETAADLLVLGTRGSGGFPQLHLGSTAERLLQSVHGPILSVHPDEAAELDPATVLIPTDLSDDAEIALDCVERFFGADPDRRLVLLHAFHLPADYGSHMATPGWQRYLTSAVGLARENLERLSTELRQRGLGVDAVVQEGSPAHAVIDQAKSRQVDLIAMATQGRSTLAQLFLGSAARRVVQRAACPVLTVRRPAQD